MGRRTVAKCNEDGEDGEDGEDVATATDELQRVDDLSNLAEDEIAMEPTGPMLEEVRQQDSLSYTACVNNCSDKFPIGSDKNVACNGFCQCVYDDNGKDLVACTMEFTDKLARL